MAASKNISYIPAVDHLRAYAAVLVLMYHSIHLISYQIIWQSPFTYDHWPKNANLLLTILEEGHTGVALFMVLSGFIFTYGSAGRDIDYRTFLLNRVLRIYPLFLVLTFIGVSAYTDRFTPGEMVLALLPLGKLAESLPLGVFGAMFWTIGVEFQFYLIFPFLYRQLHRQGVARLLLLILFLILARWSARQMGANPRELSYWTILGRLDQFLIGMIAASVARRVTFSERSLRWALPVGVVGLGFALYFFHRAGGWPLVAGWKILWPTFEALWWALIMLGYLAICHGRDGRISKAIAAVGTVSYSMYLTHMIVLAIVIKHGHFFQVREWPYLCAFINGAVYILPVTLLVSALTYQVIEKPFLELRRRYLEPDARSAPGMPLVVQGEHRPSV